MGETTNPHWSRPLAAERFSAKGYVPQALTHGTLENEDIEASERFYREVLGLEVVKLWPNSCYVKHPATPWYVVCLQALKQNRQHLSRYQRFTLAVESAGAVHAAYRSLERQSRGVENQRSREGRSHCRRGLFALQRSQRQLVGDHQRTSVVNETQKQQPSASGEFSFGRIPAFDTGAATVPAM